MSAAALQACVLLAIDARDGEWLSLAYLAQRLGIAPDRLLPVMQALEQSGQVLRMDVCGEPCWGVHVTSGSSVRRIEQPLGRCPVPGCAHGRLVRDLVCWPHWRLVPHGMRLSLWFKGERVSRAVHRSAWLLNDAWEARQQALAHIERQLAAQQQEAA